ncbi:helix-turn-helix domain-containing protein [Pseudomonas sp. RT4P38]
MSVQAMAWALSQQVVTESHSRHVLLCLANYADQSGRAAFPAVSSLALDTGLAPRTVQYRLRDLEKMGLIARGNQAVAAAYITQRDRVPVCYDLDLSRGAHDAPRAERGAPQDATGCTPEQNGVHATTERGAQRAPNPSINHPLTILNQKEGAKAPETLGKGKAQKFDPLTARPENVSTEAWAGFCEMRKAKRKDLTERACQLIAKKLANHPEPDAVLDTSTTNSWSDIYPESVLPGAGAKKTKAAAYTNLPVHTEDMYQGGGNGPAF